MSLACPRVPLIARFPRSTAFALSLLASGVVAFGAAARAAEAAGATAYVSNQNGDISVIDLATLKVTGSISPYGKEPRGIGVTADGKMLVVANREGGRVAVIDRASGKLLRQVEIGANPEFVRTRGHLAFVSFEPASTGQAPPPASGASGPRAPRMEGSASGAGQGGKDDDDDAGKPPAQVAIVDLDRGQVVRTIVGGRETEGIEFAADGRHILVTNEADDNVSVHEIATGRRIKVIDTKPFGKRPRGVKLSPDGKTYVVTLEFANAFIVLDDRYDVVKTVRTGESPYGVSFDRAGDRLFVATARSKLLQVFDTRTWTPVKDIPVGNRCWHFSFTPDDRQILVACGRSDELVVIDAAKLEPVEHIADKEMPWGVVTYPKAMGSLDRPE
jgi:YVTN family beta-propeller protein